MKKILLIALIFSLNLGLFAQKRHVISTSKDFIPLYISALRDLNRFYLYANGGDDANWYVGYNNCWIVQFPPVQYGTYKRAFIGAKLGRAKTMSKADRPWETEAIPGNIFVGLSPNTSFTSRQSYLLVKSDDIPKEVTNGDYLENTGNSQWFFTEIPIAALSNIGNNYLALWSDSENFDSSKKSPIVAGGKTPGISDIVWINRSMKGTAPIDGKTALEIPVNGLAPAIMIKLVPENDLKVLVRALSVSVGTADAFISFKAIGQDVYQAWVEVSHDKFNWVRVTNYMFQPPYEVTIPKSQLPESVYYLRAAAKDNLENVGYSTVLTIKPQNLE